MRELLWSLFARSALAQADTVVADLTDEGAGLASESLFGVGPARHCGGWHGR